MYMRGLCFAFSLPLVQGMFFLFEIREFTIGSGRKFKTKYKRVRERSSLFNRCWVKNREHFQDVFHSNAQIMPIYANLDQICKLVFVVDSKHSKEWRSLCIGKEIHCFIKLFLFRSSCVFLKRLVRFRKMV